MVEGLKAARPLVKFRRVLPVAALLFVTASTYRYYHTPTQLLRLRGVEVEARAGTPPSIVATAVNLPAGVLALPIETALGIDSLRSTYYEVFRVAGFSLFGVIFWFAAGRFIDDVIAWQSVRSGSRWRLSDCMMAALIAAEGTLVLIAFTMERSRGGSDLWLVVAATCWALLGYSALLFRIVQFRAYPRSRNRRK